MSKETKAAVLKAVDKIRKAKNPQDKLAAREEFQVAKKADKEAKRKETAEERAKRGRKLEE